MKMKTKTKSAAESLITTVAAAAALILLNVLSCGSHKKIDLTEQKIYTLSDGSRDLVSQLPERLLVKAYFGNIPAEHAEKQEYVENLLTEYAGASNGKLAWEKVDPWKQQELQKDLAKEGIRPIQILSIKADKREQVPAYFTIQFTYLDKKETWELDPRRGFEIEGLEYDFTTRIKRLAQGKKTVGITSGFGEPQAHQALDHKEIGLSALYDVKSIDWAQSPKQVADPDVLIVNGPARKVSDAARWYLDQRLMAGKPTLMLIRGMEFRPGSDKDPGMTAGDTPFLGTAAEHGLGDLLAHYGFEVRTDLMVDPRHAVQGVVPLGREPLLTTAFFPVVEVLAKERNQLLEGIGMLALPYHSTMALVGPLEKGTIEGGELLPLLRSSSASSRVKDMVLLTRTTEKLSPSRDDSGPYTLGYQVTGVMRSFYAGKPLPEGVDAAAKAIDQGTVRLVFLSGSDFVSDQTAMMAMRLDPRYGAGFQALHNIVDWLVQDTQLVGVRGKQVARPLEPIDDDKKLVLKLANLAGPPAGLAIFGLIYWQVRSRRRRRVAL